MGRRTLPVRPDRYAATTDAIEHIAALVVQQRPEWDAALVKIILHSHAGQVDGNDLAIAALRAAGNPDLPTPKAIGWRGRHWDGLGTVPPDVAPAERCFVCGKREPECWSSRPGRDDDHVFEPRPVTR